MPTCIVKNVRGSSGGYILKRDADGIFIAQIVDAVDELIDAAKAPIIARAVDLILLTTLGTS